VNVYIYEFFSILLGISTHTPRGLFNVRGYTGGTAGSLVANFNENVVIGGAYNQIYNTGNSVLLHISDYSNDSGDNVYPIYVEDENNNIAFYINGGTTAGPGTAYFGGSLGLGTTSPQAKLHVVIDREKTRFFEHPPANRN
jgi:hypothetical protein